LGTRGTGDNDTLLIAATSRLALIDKSSGDPEAMHRFILMGVAVSGDEQQHASLVPVKGSTHPWYIRVKTKDDVTNTRLYFVPYVSTPTQAYLRGDYVPTTACPLGSGMSGNPANVPV